MDPGAPRPVGGHRAARGTHVHPQTYAATRSALEGLGIRVAAGERLRDVDHLADVAPVAAAAPHTRFAVVAAEIARVAR